MADEAAVRGALAEMLERIEMTPQEIEALTSRARDAAYWTGLAPGLTIGQPAPPQDALVDDECARMAAEHLRRDRYFKTDPVIGTDALVELNRAIDAVHAAGWPAVFALVYDSFWTCFRHPFISRLVSGHFGGDYRQIPHVWVHVVPARSGARGWMPHFDDVLRSRRLTVWVALNEATVDNGCIHIIPPDSLPDSFRTTNFDSNVVMRDALRAMHATRALEAEAGALLGWEFDVFHWGGRAAAPKAERRSISLEFLAAGEATYPNEIPLLDVTGSLPDFGLRLRVISIALESYAGREAALRRFRAVAPRLVA